MNRHWLLPVALAVFAGCTSPQTRLQSEDDTDRDREPTAVEVKTVGDITEVGGVGVVVIEVDDVRPATPGSLEALRHEVHANDLDRPALERDANCHLPDRSEPEDCKGSAIRDGGVLDRLPRGGKDVGEIDEAVVRGTFRHLDVGELGLRDAQ